MIQYNGLTLAYIGDAVFELKIREHLLKKGLVKVNDLHNAAISYTQAKSQASIISFLIDGTLLEDEISIYKRGRNQNSSHKPKNADVQTYNMATGFETLIGYLYLDENFSRLDEIMKISIEYIDKNND